MRHLYEKELLLNESLSTKLGELHHSVGALEKRYWLGNAGALGSYIKDAG